MAETTVARGLPLAGAYGLEVKNSRRCWSFFHEAYCVTLVTAGHGRWRYRRRDADITPHSLMLMEPGEVHATTAVKSPGDFHALFFSPALVRDVLEAAPSGAPHLRLLGTAQPELVRGFHTACSLLAAGAEEESQRQHLSLALARLFEHSGEGARVAQAVPITRVRKAARLLRDTYESAPWKTVQLAPIASAVGMNYHWLVHSFAAEFGIAPYQYVQALRLARMRGLLLRGPSEGLRSLSDIATALGFTDKSHLHRSVKRQYGISPWQLALELNPSWSRATSNG
jgi:AraC-like DNA-binding protein